jgi:hypothetical protein
VKRDTIKSLAKEIQQRWPYLTVRIERGYCNTDRKIGRLRWEGKGRWGSRIIVTTARGVLLLDHNNAETYRRTSDVRRWIDRYAAAAGVRKSIKRDRVR